jgi:hypothetical protein
MQYRVIRFGNEAGVEFNQTYRHLPTAVRMYYRQLHRHKGAHVLITRTGGLPGLEDKTIAERFGDREERS